MTEPDNELVREVTPGGTVTTIAGAIPVPSGGYENGLGRAAEFENPSGIAYDSATGSLIVTSSADGTIRVVEP